jgi:serine protease Do
MRERFQGFIGKMTLILAGGLLIGSVLPSGPLAGVAMAASGSGGDGVVPEKEIAAGLALQKTFEAVSKAVLPAVVNISTTSLVSASPHMPPMFDDPFFKRFFGNPFGQGGAPQKHVERSLGSGFIISSDGTIVTNNHVVKNATKVTVLLSNKKSYQAKVIGTDPMTDIAVIKIDPRTPLPVVTWGDSKNVDVGTIVLAMGSPFGLTQSVTMGIVSALKRSNMGIEQYENFIQTDAAINPGNSGGPLVNLRGEVVGMNTAIYTTNGGYEGIGFAIPVTMVRQVVQDLMTKGKVVRGWLGISIQNVTPVIAKQFGLKKTSGVLVSDVLPGSPAEKARLKRGDVVVALNGTSVEDANDLRMHVARIAPGKTAELTIVRSGETRKIDVRVGELPRKLAMNTPQGNGSAGNFKNVLKGLRVMSLNSDIRSQLGIPSSVRGVIIQAVQPGSAVEVAGLRRGDVVIEVDRKPVRSLSDFVRIARHIPENAEVLLTILHDGRHSYVSVSP